MKYLPIFIRVASQALVLSNLEYATIASANRKLSFEIRNWCMYFRIKIHKPEYNIL